MSTPTRPLEPTGKTLSATGKRWPRGRWHGRSPGSRPRRRILWVGPGAADLVLSCKVLCASRSNLKPDTWRPCDCIFFPPASGFFRTGHDTRETPPDGIFGRRRARPSVPRPGSRSLGAVHSPHDNLIFPLHSYFIMAFGMLLDRVGKLRGSEPSCGS